MAAVLPLFPKLLSDSSMTTGAQCRPLLLLRGFPSYLQVPADIFKSQRFSGPACKRWPSRSVASLFAHGPRVLSNSWGYHKTGATQGEILGEATNQILTNGFILSIDGLRKAQEDDKISTKQMRSWTFSLPRDAGPLKLSCVREAAGRKSFPALSGPVFMPIIIFN